MAHSKQQIEELIQQKIIDYRNKFGTDLADDVKTYAETRKDSIERKFIEFGIMHITTIKGATEARAYWQTSKPINPLARKCVRYFLLLCSGLPTDNVRF